MKPTLLIPALLLSGAFLIGSTTVTAASSSEDTLSDTNQQGVENIEKNKEEQKDIYDSSEPPQYDPSTEPGKIEDNNKKSAPSSSTSQPQRNQQDSAPAQGTSNKN